jgi:hypothetical protein
MSCEWAEEWGSPISLRIHKKHRKGIEEAFEEFKFKAQRSKKE